MNATYLKAGFIWLLSASMTCGPAAAAGLPSEAAFAEALAASPDPSPITAARDAEPESICVLPVAEAGERASSACREELVAARAPITANRDQEGLLTAMDAIIDGAWPVSEAGCRVVLQKARAVDVLRPMSTRDVAGAVCGETGLSCLEVRPAGAVASGCGAAAEAVPVSGLPTLALQTEPLAPPSQHKPYSQAFRISEGFAWGGLAFDMGTTTRGLSLGGSEAGIYRVVGERNTAGILFMAAGVEVLLTIVSRRVYRSGSTKTASVLNIIRGSVHVAAGAQNMRLIRQLDR